MTRVAICTPISRAPIADYMHSLQRLLASVRDGYEILPIYRVGEANTPRVRNTLAQVAMDHGADEIVFIDDDIGFEPGDFWRLFDVPDSFRVVAGVYRRRGAETDKKLWACYQPEGFKSHENWFTGRGATGFMRIRRDVLLQLSGEVDHYYNENAASAKNPDGLCFAWFNYGVYAPKGVEKPQFNGEDYYFCDLCEKNGIDVWLDPVVNLRHWNTAPLTGRLIDDMAD